MKVVYIIAGIFCVIVLSIPYFQATGSEGTKTVDFVGTPTATSAKDNLFIHPTPIECVSGESVAVEVSAGDSIVGLSKSNTDVLCTLFYLEVSTNSEIKPVGRSYEGHDWENYSGDFASLKYTCTSSSCSVELPLPATGYGYSLVGYQHSLPPNDETARFLEQTTFGPRLDDLSAVNGFVLWVKDQQNMPISSHRQYFRERANSRHEHSLYQSEVTHPCGEGTSYRNFAFSEKAYRQFFEIKSTILRGKRGKKLILTGDGQPVTVVNGPIQGGDENEPNPSWKFPDGVYEICMVPEEGLGGRIQFSLDGKTCLSYMWFGGVLGNPPVFFNRVDLASITCPVINISGHTIPFGSEFYDGENQEVLVNSPLSDSNCNSLLKVSDLPKTTVIGFSDDANEPRKYWLHTPTFKMLDNTLSSPIVDGGKAAVDATLDAPNRQYRVKCSNAPRTFLNEDHCVLSYDGACTSNNEAQDSSSLSPGGALVVCGTPFETANNLTIYSRSSRGGFDYATPFNQSTRYRLLVQQKTTVWTEIALKASDQLRQRVAWAILVVSTDAIHSALHTESFLTYYDIFVRNAFGNYRDILKEVAYSPLMGEMLTYLNSKSTGFVWTRKSKLEYADENFAREMMQLFSIGLYMLNDDGTRQLDEEGVPIRTYTITDIAEYARVWTGFSTHKKRGNIEDRVRGRLFKNQVDSMWVRIRARDHLPKMGLKSQYIGDGYPLCAEAPSQHFLKTGATFRLLGTDPNPELQHDPDWFVSAAKRFSLEAESSLGAKLCNKAGANDKNSACSYPVKLILGQDLTCVGMECHIDSLRTFEVSPGSGIFYEYLRRPCVHHAFYNDAKTIIAKGGSDSGLCANPASEAASTTCCTTAERDENSERAETFSGERVSFALAKGRCEEQGKHLCYHPKISKSECITNGGCDRLGVEYWSSQSCNLQTKIDLEGNVAIMHEPNVVDIGPTGVRRMVQQNTKMFFRVEWTKPIDDLLEDYVNQCMSMGCAQDISPDGLCVCNVKNVEDITTFNIAEQITDTISNDDILSQVAIGALPPTSSGSQIREGIKQYPPGGLTADTVFEIVDLLGVIHFRKNVKSVVSIGTGDSSLSFRNPVHFISNNDPEERDAHYETDAVLDQYFYHQNVAPFLAIRFAQRFGISNPSPRFVSVIVDAFRTGHYTNNGTSFGAGKYGDLAATIAAVVLDREARSVVLDADPMHGSILEPFMKIIRLMRSLEFHAADKYPLARISHGFHLQEVAVKSLNLQDIIGQEPHKLPSVFSFFQPEFQSAGRVTQAGMVAPESQVLTGPNSVNLMNTMISLIKFGLAKCYEGFGILDLDSCRIGDTSSSQGALSYLPNTASPKDIIDELATLLTSGRLSADNRAIVEEAYNQTLAAGKDANEALINAQQLIVTTAEFNSNGLIKKTGAHRDPRFVPSPTGNNYKAVVYVMLNGGVDSYNMLIPKTCSGTNAAGLNVAEQYKKERGVIALETKLLDLTIDVGDGSQPCEEFAVHPELPFLKELYDDGYLSFFANTGVINQNGLDKTNYNRKTRTQLIAHNTMEEEVRKVDPYDSASGTGVLGRAAGILQDKGFVVNAMSIDKPAIALEGRSGNAPAPVVVSRFVTKTFDPSGSKEDYLDTNDFVARLNSETGAHNSSIFGETWSRQVVNGINEGFILKETMGNVIIDPDIWCKSPDDGDGLCESEEGNYDGSQQKELWDKFSTIYKLIGTRESRSSDRDIIYTSFGGWDTHSQMLDETASKFNAVNYGLSKFVAQLQAEDLWEKVTLVFTSDFARTITPNSGAGSDHAWGGHYFMMGGDVKGKKIHGQFPNDITIDGPLNIKQGRMLPTTSWDAIWNGITEWMGVDPSELDVCLPNRNNTVEAGFKLFSKKDLFGPKGQH